MRPILKPGLGRVWLDPNTLQLGRGPRRRVHRLDSAERVLLEALDGTRDTDALLRYGERLGLTSERSLGLLNRLALAGALDDAALPTPGLARLSIGERARLGPVVSALGLRNGLPGGGARALERRAQQHAVVHGLGLIGAQVARHLAAAGVGVVRPVDPGPADHRDTGPGALDPAHVGKRRQEAVCRAIQRDTPSTRVAPAYPPRRPDIVVIAPVERYPLEVFDGLVSSGAPHLLVRPAEDEVLVGPLVLPGRTPCIHCADLQLSESDPSWPRFLAQYGTPRPGELPPGDTSLMLLAAAYAVQYALAHLDGARPTVIGAVMSLRPPDATPVRLEIAAHDACGCGAAYTDWVDADAFSVRGAMADAEPSPEPAAARTAPATPGRRAGGPLPEQHGAPGDFLRADLLE